ncbi:protein involved in membrane traffic, putative, partial [Ixodes scapularis]
IRALEKREPASMQKWTSYWLIFAILNVFLGCMCESAPCDWLVRSQFLLLCWCACPLESNGADYLYGWILAHRLFRPLVHNMGPPKKAHAPPSQGDEKSGDVGRALPPRIEKARK